MANIPQALKDFDITSTASSEAAAQFVDVDLAFRANRFTGDIFVKKGDRAVAQALRVLALTNPGDLPNEPDFGVGVYSILGENFDPVSVLALKDRIDAQIKEYEPRVELLDVVVGQQGNSITIKIAYIVRNDPTERAVTVNVERVL